MVADKIPSLLDLMANLILKLHSVSRLLEYCWNRQMYLGADLGPQALLVLEVQGRHLCSHLEQGKVADLTPQNLLRAHFDRFLPRT